MGAILPFVVLSAVAGIIGGCTGFVKSNVAVFHSLPEKLEPTRYAFIALKGQEDSLEFSTYQGLIRTELQKYDYQDVDVDDADVIIAFSYGIDSGREKLASMPIFGQTGVSSSTTFGGVSTYGNYGTFSGTTTYTPTYGIVGTSTYSRTEYTRGLWLYIVDKKSVASGKMKLLYEGNVISAGSSSQLAQVMPAMVQALFKQFPGKSGSTRTVTLPMQ